MGAHEPYEPLAACAARSEGYDRYLCALRLLDERVGDILRALSDAGLGDDTVVVISADHGEEFGEHGARYHANTVYDEVLRVPLLVRIPGGTAETIREPVGCFDSCRRCSEPPIFRAIRSSSATTFHAGRVPAVARNSLARVRSKPAACSSRRPFPSWSGTRSSSSIDNRVSRSISTFAPTPRSAGRSLTWRRARNAPSPRTWMRGSPSSRVSPYRTSGPPAQDTDETRSFERRRAARNDERRRRGIGR